MPTERPPKQAAKKIHDEEMHLEHVHIFQTLVDVARDHQHLLTGTTGVPIAKGRSHIHNICVKTSYDPKGGPAHWHGVDIITGPAIPLDCDEHTHEFQGNTSLDLGHCHAFCSVTDASGEYGEDCEEEEEDYIPCKPCKCKRTGDAEQE
jgi:hypothetical protein